MQSYWILEHFNLTSCLILILTCQVNKIIFTVNKIALQQTVIEQLCTVCKSFVTGKTNSFTKNYESVTTKVLRLSMSYCDKTVKGTT